MILETAVSSNSEITNSTACANNALLPVSKLPVEIFREIFLLLSLSADLWSRGRSGNGCGYNWSFSAVCRRWREIALECPRLWTRVGSSMCLNQVRTYLKRSKEASLFVVCYSDHCSPSSWNHLVGFCELVCANLGRIKELDVYDASKEGWEDMHKMFVSSSMPRLRRLHLSSEEEHSLLSILSGSPNNFTHSVRHLSNVFAPWEHHLLRGLSSLILEDIPTEHQPTLLQLLDILEGCPGLKKLELQDAGPNPSDSHISTPRLVTVPQLHDITIEGFDFKFCKGIFDSIVVSPNPVLSIKCKNYPFQNPIPFPINQLERPIQERKKAKISIECNGISISSFEEQSGETRTTLRQSWGEEEIFGDRPVFLGGLFRSIQVISSQLKCQNITVMELDVESVYYNGSIYYDNSFWMPLLNLLRTVQDLKIKLKDGPDLTKTFIRAFVGTNPETPHDIKLPNLQNFDIVGANFHFRKTKRHTPEDYFAILLNHFTYRYEIRGKRLSRLSLIHCYGVKKRQYKALWDVVFSDEICWEPLKYMKLPITLNDV